MYRDANAVLERVASHALCAIRRQAEEAEARAQAAQGCAAAAVRGARQAGARLRGKEAEVDISDLHAAAQARLSGWSAWVTSRNSMDESLQEKGDDTVRSLKNLQLQSKEYEFSASLFQQGLCSGAQEAADAHFAAKASGWSGHFDTAETQPDARILRATAVCRGTRKCSNP